MSCPLDHTEWPCLPEMTYCKVSKAVSQDLYDAMKIIAKKKGITLRVFLEIALRRVVEEYKEELK